jgi:hypothetical protein
VDGRQLLPALEEGGHLGQAVAAAVQDHGVGAGRQALLQHWVVGNARLEEDNLLARFAAAVGGEHLQLGRDVKVRRGQTVFQPL